MLNAGESEADGDKGGRNIRWRRRLFAVGAVLFLLAVVLASTGAIYQMIRQGSDEKRYPPPGQMVDIGGHRLHVQVMGRGGPTVVLEAGAGGTSLDWTEVQNYLADVATVVSYDRAGLGWSEPGPLPRTSKAIVGELRALLAAIGVQPPYILVGHSFGGLDVRFYAATHPGEVAGVVLLDPVPVDLFSRMPDAVRQGRDAQLGMLAAASALTRFGVPRLFFPPLATRGLPEGVQPAADARGYRRETYATVREEARSFNESADEVRTHPMPADLKLVVLSRSNPELWPPGVSSEEAERIWADLQSEIAARSTNAKHVIVENSGHYIQIDRPDVVVQTIKQMISETPDRPTPDQGADQ